eukprot:GHVN01059359.1.p2 GENE.GHVN01059359.1~~GHVN01059359.1.p2  ORF type:complete len:402 (+),score=60.19 GHVN01059359.1:3150-4355(+)
MKGTKREQVLFWIQKHGLHHRTTNRDGAVLNLVGIPGRGNGWLVEGQVQGLAFTKGDLVYTEEPAASHSHFLSSRCSVVCAHCMKVVSSVVDNLKTLVANEKVSLEKEFPSICETLDNCKFNERDAISCSRGCGEFFCRDQSCQQNGAEGGWHKILCGEAHPLQHRAFTELKRHALKLHEGFILATKVYAAIINLVKHHGWPLDEAMIEFSVYHNQPWHELDATPAHPSRGTPTTPEERLKASQESFELLKKCLPAVSGEPSWAPLFEFGYFSNLLGSFDLVNVNIEFENKQDREVMEALNASQVDKREIKSLRALCHRAGFGIADQDTFIFPPVRGWGLYPTVSMTNHSCEPNVEVEFNHSSMATVTACRDIYFGEEIVQSYVDEDMGLAERQLTLQKVS